MPEIATPSAHLFEVLTPLRRWCQFCMQLDSVKSLIQSKGPTAALGARRSLAQSEGLLGMYFCTDQHRVRAASGVPSWHEERQATPFRLRHLRFLEHLATSDSEAISWIAIGWLLLALGVMRWAHVQRSTLVELTVDSAIFRCGMGKSARNGSRRPFRWSVFRYLQNGFDLGARLQSLLQTHAVSRPPLIPNFGPPRASVSELTSALVGEELSGSRMVRFLRQLMLQADIVLPDTSSKGFSTYSARRMLPTVADALGFDEKASNAIGAWGEQKQQNGSVGTRCRFGTLIASCSRLC